MGTTVHDTDRNLGVCGHPDPLIGIHRITGTAAVAIESRRMPSPMAAPSHSSVDVGTVPLDHASSLITGRIVDGRTVRVQDPRRQQPRDRTSVDDDQDTQEGIQ